MIISGSSNDRCNFFVWNGKKYGNGSHIKLKDEFVKYFTWQGGEIWNEAWFDHSYYQDGKKWFQFHRYHTGPHYIIWQDEYKYQPCFSLTEKELLNAIEDVTIPVDAVEIIESPPSISRKEMKETYEGRCKFFEFEGKYYGQGTYFYITDEFIKMYKQRTGVSLTKKMMFFCSKNQKVGHVNTYNKLYWVSVCEDMLTEEEKRNNHHPAFYVLTEQDFMNSIEMITDSCPVKKKDWEDPGIFVFWALYILVLVVSYIIFLKPSAIWVAATLIFFKFRKKVLG